MGVETRIVDKKVLSVQLVRGYGKTIAGSLTFAKAVLKSREGWSLISSAYLLGRTTLDPVPVVTWKGPGNC